MSAEKRFEGYYKKLKAEYQLLSKSLQKQSAEINAIKDPDQRIIALNAYIGTVFVNTFSLIKYVMNFLGGTLSANEAVEQDLSKLRGETKSSIKGIKTDNQVLMEELAKIVAELKNVNKRLLVLESKSPRGKGPSGPSQMQMN